VLTAFKFNTIDNKKKKILSTQAGVMRTNCMDCLDRTNYVQSRLGLVIFQQAINNFSEFHHRERLNEFELFKNKQEDSSLLLKNFNRVWGDNGDSISLHYTGIGSTHTE
jgi:hypothetical protein